MVYIGLAGGYFWTIDGGEVSKGFKDWALLRGRLGGAGVRHCVVCYSVERKSTETRRWGTRRVGRRA